MGNLDVSHYNGASWSAPKTYAISATLAPGGADQDIETITTTAGMGNSCLAMASFKAAGTVALVGVVGNVATGSNVAVGPATGALAFGQATTLANLLVAWVSGSDHTPGTPGQTFGHTAAATSSWDWSGVNTDNQVMSNSTYTPAANGTLTSLSVYMGGHTAPVNTRLCIWSSGGTLLAKTAQFSAGTGRALHTVAISLAVTAGTPYFIGFWRDPAKDAEWGVAVSGSFRTKYSATAGSGSGMTVCGGAYTCGDMQAYATYTTTSSTTPITSASTGWVKASDSSNGDEEAQIWYRPNCGAGETAPTFTTAGGSTPMYAQLAEFSGAATASPVDKTGTAVSATASLTANASAADGTASDLIVSAVRWALGSAATATFSTTYNNATAVNAGNTGASSLVRQSNFSYGIIGAAVPITLTGYNSLTVLRNCVEETSIRLSLATSVGPTAGILTADIRLRRGDRLAHLYLYSTSLSLIFQLALDSTEAATAITYGAVTLGGIRATTNDGDGNRYVLLSYQGAAPVNDLTNGAITQGAAGLVADYAIGSEVGGSSATAGLDDAVSIAKQYIAAQSEEQRVVSR